MTSRRLLIMSLISLLAIPVFAADHLEPPENLVAEGIAEIPKALVDAVSRYTESRGASMLDWHPTERAMLISTRFGNTSQVHLVKSPLGARTQLTFFREPVGNAIFDPQQGRYFLLTRDTGGNEFSQIFRFDLDTQRTTLLTDGQRSQNGGWTWNRAKNQIAFASTSRNGVDRDIWTMTPTDPESRKLLQEVRGGGWSVQDWSHDDRQLLVREYLSVNHSRLHLLDLESGKIKNLTPATGEVSYGRARFAFDRKSLIATSDQDDEFQRFVSIDLETGRQTPWQLDIPWDVEDFELSPNGKQLAFVANVAGVSQLSICSMADRSVKQIEAWPACQIGLGPWRAPGDEFAVTISSPTQTADVYSVRANTGEVIRWTESELGGVIPAELAPAERIAWKSFDGRQISGFLYRAAKFDGPRPVIINIHGGPEGQSRPSFQGRNNYFINELGIVMIYPNVRGSSGYGKSFLKLDNGLLREDSVKDIGALLDWIGQQPDLDPSRILITGGSYGGYMTLACATHYNDRIAAALDVVGISHFGTFLKNTEGYRRDLRRVEYGDERDPEIAAFFERTAPLNNADKITKPLFVVQGGNDPRVPLSESEQMVAKVRQNGTPVWYLMAKDEGHGFRKKPNADYQFYATVQFVRRFLLDEQPVK